MHLRLKTHIKAFNQKQKQPDIVTRNWPDPEFFNQLELNKYKMYCINVTPTKFGDEFPIYVKNNSKNINYDKLITCSNKTQ